MLPPRPKQIPKEFQLHGETRIDPYYWMRERENPEVIRHLNEENRYTEASLGHVKDLQETLFKEMTARIDPVDSSPPVRLDDFWYYARYEDGADYPLICRRAGSADGPESVLLNGPELAKGKPFWNIASYKVSWNQDILAYAVDEVGRRQYKIHFRNLTSGEAYEDVLPDAGGAMAWAADNETLFYVKQDPETLRWDRVFRHRLGTDPNEDVLVFEETDETFGCSVGRTKSKRFVLITSFHTDRTEVRFLDTSNPTGTFTVFVPRSGTHEYGLDHAGDRFYIRTNHEAENFRVMSCPLEDTRLEAWEEVIPHREDVLLEDFDVFENFLVLEERSQGLMHIRIRGWDGKEQMLPFDEPAYYAGLSSNPTFDTDVLRYEYTSMTTPATVYDFNMKTQERTLVQQKRVIGDFDPANYVTDRIWAPAEDGTQVPISIVYRKGFENNGRAPLVLYGYGSYGASTDASFVPNRLSLLDRGFAYAIAHIRGGEELGRRWYEEGRKLAKLNTFTDFIACAEHLVSEKYTSSDRMFAFGGSAGGLLMGAVVNMRPDLFHGVVAAVPFVDVLTTMLDETIPLTTGEYDEWGNPNDETSYRYMRTYSPYDNVAAVDYPHMLVTTGFHDSQVQYWEPAKWVARLRDLSTSKNPILLRTNMDAGHGGASGRYERYKEVAADYAFILGLAGIRE